MCYDIALLVFFLEKAELKEQKPEANKADFELTDDIEVDRELLDAVEQLRTRKKIERNVVDEDVEKLSLFSFDGQMYRCDLCKILCRQIKVSSHPWWDSLMVFSVSP